MLRIKNEDKLGISIRELWIEEKKNVGVLVGIQYIKSKSELFLFLNIH